MIKKLYDVPRGSRFILVEKPHTPPDSLDGIGQVYRLGSIDGMYSWSIGEDGERYYFAAWTEVEVIDDDS